MRLNTGVDMVDINRIEKSMSNPRFVHEIFSDAERALFSQRGDSAATVAGNFAAKEAFSKAVGTGVSGFSLSEISILRDKKGQPYFVLSGNAEQLYSTVTFSVSISHTQTHAVAFVVAIFENNMSNLTGQV